VSKRDGPVAYVLRKFPVLSETFVLNELLGLQERGVPLVVFSLLRPNDPRFHEDLSRLKAPVYFLPDLFDLGKILRHHRRLRESIGVSYRKTLLYTLSRRKRALLWRFLQAGFLANEARRLHVRHFHAQFANSPTTVAHLASRLTGIPFSFTAHAMDIYKHRVNRSALTRKVRDARFVVTVSDYNKTFMDRLTHAPEGRILRIYNGIDIERYSPNGQPSPEPFRILCVARFVEKKGIPTLVEACRILRDEGVDFHCDIVGKGRLRPFLRDRIKQAGLGDHVVLHGAKSQLEVLEFYHSAHLYVLPCRVGEDGNREGLPVSIVEALACGLPVVSTPITGIPEAVRDGENGFLIPPDDPEELARVLRRIVEDRMLYDSLRSRAREPVATLFDQTRTITELERLMMREAG